MRGNRHNIVRTLLMCGISSALLSMTAYAKAYSIAEGDIAITRSLDTGTGTYKTVVTQKSADGTTVNTSAEDSAPVIYGTVNASSANIYVVSIKNDDTENPLNVQLGDGTDAGGNLIIDAETTSKAALTTDGAGETVLTFGGVAVRCSSGAYHAGLEKLSDGKLTISDEGLKRVVDFYVYGGLEGAGIGGGQLKNGSNIEISLSSKNSFSSLNLHVTGGKSGAGIGGGSNGAGKNITITTPNGVSQSKLYVTGGEQGAGIGGGYAGYCDGITVDAPCKITAGAEAAAIGSGSGSQFYNINIGDSSKKSEKNTIFLVGSVGIGAYDARTLNSDSIINVDGCYLQIDCGNNDDSVGIGANANYNSSGELYINLGDADIQITNAEYGIGTQSARYNIKSDIKLDNTKLTTLSGSCESDFYIENGLIECNNCDLNLVKGFADTCRDKVSVKINGGTVISPSLNLSKTTTISGAAKVTAKNASTAASDYTLNTCGLTTGGYLQTSNGIIHGGVDAEIHILGTATTKTEATCTATGLNEQTCSRCKKKIETATEVLGHEFTKKDESDTKYRASEATCTSPAYYYYSCPRCGETGTETFAATAAAEQALGHQYKADDTDAYANKWDYNADDHYEICIRDICSDRLGSIKNKAAHSFDKKVEDDKYLAAEASCKSNAKYHYSCECGLMGSETFEKAGSKLEHDYSNGYSKNANGHWQACKNCGAMSDAGVEAHEFAVGSDECSVCSYNRTHVCSKFTYVDEVSASCDTDGSIAYYECDLDSCRLKYKDGFGRVLLTDSEIKIAAHHAIEEDYVPAKEATCTEGGNVKYYTCSECKKTFSDRAGKKELTTVTIPVMAHSTTETKAKAASCTEEGNVQYFTCSTCKQKFDAKGNVITEVKIPKTEHEYSGNTCTVCGCTKPGSGSDSGSESGSGSGSTSGGGNTSGSGNKSGSGSSGGTGRGAVSTGGGSGSGSGISGSSTGHTANNVQGSWEQQANGGWKFRYINGAYAAGNTVRDASGNSVMKLAWARINGADYAFGQDGSLKSGWVKDESTGKWYYCDPVKGARHGWFYDEEAKYWYYFDENSKAMVSGWQHINGKDYYFAPEPVTSTYSYDAAQDKWVYDTNSAIRPYGSLYVDTTTPDGHKVDKDGVKIQ